MIGEPIAIIFEEEQEFLNAQNKMVAGIAFGARSPSGPESPKAKAGVLVSGDFSGTPKTSVVTFEAPFPDDSYSIVLSGEDSRIFTYFSKTINGFHISANANGALTGEVSWVATPIGEG